jgi:hypothetical protein
VKTGREKILCNGGEAIMNCQLCGWSTLFGRKIKPVFFH